MQSRKGQKMGGIGHVGGCREAPYDTRESGSDGARALQMGGIVHVGVAVSRSRMTWFWSRPSRDSSSRSSSRSKRSATAARWARADQGEHAEDR